MTQHPDFLRLFELEKENAELRKLLIDCQDYSAKSDLRAREYKEALDMFLAKDGLEWSPGSGLSAKRPSPPEAKP